MKNKCKHCGAKLEGFELFCPECGRTLDDSAMFPQAQTDTAIRKPAPRKAPPTDWLDLSADTLSRHAPADEPADIIIDIDDDVAEAAASRPAATSRPAAVDISDEEEPVDLDFDFDFEQPVKTAAKKRADLDLSVLDQAIEQREQDHRMRRAAAEAAAEKKHRKHRKKSGSETGKRRSSSKKTSGKRSKRKKKTGLFGIIAAPKKQKKRKVSAAKAKKPAKRTPAKAKKPIRNAARRTRRPETAAVRRRPAPRKNRTPQKTMSAVMHNLLLIGTLAVTVLLVFVMMNLLSGLFFGKTPNYEFNTVMNTYFDSVLTANPDEFISTRPDEYIEYLTAHTTSPYPSLAAYRGSVNQTLITRLADYTALYGDVRAVRYRLDTVKMYTHRTAALSQVLASWYGFEHSTVTDAVVISGTYTVQGVDSSGNYEFTDMLLIRIDGKWYFSPDAGSYWKNE